MGFFTGCAPLVPSRREARTRTHAHARTHTHTHARTHTHTHTRTRARTHTRARARTHARTHTHTHAHTRAHTRKPARTCQTPPSPARRRHRSLAFAALSFNRDNGFGPRVYSIGTACFYVSFMLLMARAPAAPAGPRGAQGCMRTRKDMTRLHAGRCQRRSLLGCAGRTFGDKRRRCILRSHAHPSAMPTVQPPACARERFLQKDPSAPAPDRPPSCRPTWR
jgi:hypothetical protein